MDEKLANAFTAKYLCLVQRNVIFFEFTYCCDFAVRYPTKSFEADSQQYVRVLGIRALEIFRQTSSCVDYSARP